MAKKKILLDNAKSKSVTRPISDACDRLSQEVRTPIKFYSSDELRAMTPAEVVSHAIYLQDLYRQAESDNTFLTWEFQEARENYTYFSRVAKLAHKLNASNIDAIADLAVNEIPSYFNCRFAALFFYDAEAMNLQLYRATRPAPSTGPLHLEGDNSHFLVKLFFGQSAPFIVEYGDSDTVIVSDTAEKIVAAIPPGWHELLGQKAIIFPLRGQDPDTREPLILGGLIAGDSSSGLESRDAEVAAVFADLLSSSLFNARLLKRLNELTIVDPLTNTYNRRHLINQLGAAMIQARRHGHDLSIGMLDIDHFKRINDTYGHMVGDKVLRELAYLLRTSIRSEVDVLARFGGEEFVIIMPFVNVEHAAQAAERLRQIIRQHAFNLDGLLLDVTCSLGVASYEVGESLERFIDRADMAMYKAKQAGRDRVAAATEGGAGSGGEEER